VKSPLVVSGDVHFAELMETSCGSLDGGPSHHQLGGVVELTTSGLTHAWGIGMGHVSDELNKITALAMFLYQHVYPWSYQSKTKDENHFLGYKQNYYLRYNFGEIEFDWLNFQAITRILDGESGEVVVEKAYPFVELDMGYQEEVVVDGFAAAVARPICYPKGGGASFLRLLIGVVGCVLGVIAIMVAKPLLAFIFIRTMYRFLTGSDAVSTLDSNKTSKKKRS